MNKQELRDTVKAYVYLAKTGKPEVNYELIIDSLVSLIGDVEVPQEEKDPLVRLTGDMARRVSEIYISALYKMRIERDVSDFTLREYEKKQTEANVTAEVCLKLMDGLIISRYDYIVRNAVDHAVNGKK